ncbi:hypothetical protein pf16_22 [Pseudomonas phage pf16]|uniref:Uncharacterized protein n=1 Tax=Pseudomonas phage pf16 TaxID=1815630 RepID=A0A1S5R3Q7_9CAUD|nr:hypothetical protein FDG98_gp021 [Pseudomonas phage pf16]AND74945.1 hypothetical protein pf16_22 [Pseudomonas phage pf16]
MTNISVPRELLQELLITSQPKKNVDAKFTQRGESAFYKLDKLLRQPALQGADTDPVAWLVYYADDNTFHCVTRDKAVAERYMSMAYYVYPLFKFEGADVIISLRRQLETMTADRDAEKAMKATARDQRDKILKKYNALHDYKLPHYIKLSDEMRAAGKEAYDDACKGGCQSLNVLDAVYFEAAIQRWLNNQEEILEQHEVQQNASRTKLVEAINLLARTAKLNRDISRTGLMQGGEQYPNSLCCIDLAQDVEMFINQFRTKS